MSITTADGTDLAVLTKQALPQKLLKLEQLNGETVATANAAHILEVLRFFRDHPQCRFKFLVDLCGVDYPQREQRFEVVYHLLSVQHNQRIRIKVPLKENESIPTVTTIFSAAGWFEREAWDMYGIPFSGNTDLRRILTDYGFEGHPLRKDFPLTGYVEVRYDDERRQVVYEPVQLKQDYRNFDYLSPWEGTEYNIPTNLPGDEKAAS